MSLLLAPVVIVSSGCFPPLVRYQPFQIGVGGYAESRDASTDTWSVACGTGSRGDSRLCAPIVLYRCAELSFEQGCRYLRILEGGDQSGPIDAASNPYGGRQSVHVGYANYRIKLFKEHPGGEGVVDAYAYLDSTPLPGGGERKTVADRNRRRGRMLRLTGIRKHLLRIRFSV